MSYKQQFLRGVRLESSANKVQTCLDRLHSKYAAKANIKTQQKSKQPQLSLADFRLPSYLEDLGIFCVGSPGSGKSQAIAKLIHELQQRDDYRLVCLDRNGEFTTNFFREGKDLLFNPTDSRSVGWCHSSESASVETIASGIIPLNSTSEPFWPVSARNFLSEIYQRAETNAHVWEAVSLLSIEELKSLLCDSMFNKYFDSEKTLASIIASATTYARFYGQLPDKQDQIDFWHWAESGDERCLFLPLFEKDAQLFKPLYSMVLELIILGLLSNVEREIKTAIIIDELGALQPIGSLSRLLAEGRKSKATPIL
ncbi:MAG: type IV secretion system DNA-binding domain-containing protein, partial [Cyanobacteria bacterium P01_A01_bin.40]